MSSYSQLHSPVIAFVGRSGSGKTTLLENVVPLLLRRNIRLAVVKHTRHTIATDSIGTDTRRMWDMGVPNVILVSSDRITQWQRSETVPDLDGILVNLQDVDFIILEGFKTSTVPKIEVLRQVHNAVPLSDLVDRVAYVTDVVNLTTGLPCFALDAYEEIAEFVIRFMRRHTI